MAPPVRAAAGAATDARGVLASRSTRPQRFAASFASLRRRLATIAVNASPVPTNASVPGSGVAAPAPASGRSMLPPEGRVGNSGLGTSTAGTSPTDDQESRPEHETRARIRQDDQRVERYCIVDRLVGVVGAPTVVPRPPLGGAHEPNMKVTRQSRRPCPAWIGRRRFRARLQGSFSSPIYKRSSANPIATRSSPLHRTKVSATLRSSQIEVRASSHGARAARLARFSPALLQLEGKNT